VKPENILQCGSASAPCWKLADFGAASVSKADPCDRVSSRPPQLIQSSRAIGSDAYAAPEVVAVMDACAAANAGSGPATLPSYEVYGVDVWSFGVTLFVLASGQMPFKRACGSDAAFLGFCAATQAAVLSPRAAQVAPAWAWPAHFSSGLIELLTGCLQVDTRCRLRMPQVCAAAWMTQPPSMQCTSLRQVPAAGLWATPERSFSSYSAGSDLLDIGGGVELGVHLPYLPRATDCCEGVCEQPWTAAASTPAVMASKPALAAVRIPRQCQTEPMHSAIEHNSMYDPGSVGSAFDSGPVHCNGLGFASADCDPYR